MKRNKKCECGATMLAIVYGLPSPEFFESADREEIFLGGCVISSDSPKWRCPKCGKEKGKLKF